MLDISREELLSVRGLSPQVGIDKMSTEDFIAYIKVLDRFIETYPEKEQEIQEHFQANDEAKLIKGLQEIQKMLEEICAINLMGSCVNIIKFVGKMPHNTFEVHLMKMFSSITSLSITLQTEKSKERKDREKELEADKKRSNEAVSIPKEMKKTEKIILAVDDVSIILNSLKPIIKGTGYDFKGVNSGQLALEYLKNHNPALFILDIQMPSMDGYSLAENIRKEGHKSPIIFLTGNAQSSYVKKAVQMGIDEFIVKPIDSKIVLEKIKKYIN